MSESKRTTIRLTASGPYIVNGDCEVVDAEGKVLCEDKAALCACGKSNTKPFCDGSHQTKTSG